MNHLEIIDSVFKAADKVKLTEIDYEISGENNGESILVFEKYGIEIRIAYTFGDKWTSVINNSGDLFDTKDEAIYYAKMKFQRILLERIRDIALNVKSIKELID